jgi:hypothetical protein
MHTLYHEKYSKFISTTDAIRSIGQSVDLWSDASLDDLNFKMTRMERNTVLLEESPKQKLQQVVEKLTFKRLLHRLVTGLVELPSTLLALQGDRKYVLLMKDYLDVMKILTMHWNNSVVSAALLILFHNHEQENGEKEFGSCCGFGDRVIRRSELLGVSFIIVVPISSTAHLEALF